MSLVKKHAPRGPDFSRGPGEGRAIIPADLFLYRGRNWPAAVSASAPRAGYGPRAKGVAFAREQHAGTVTEVRRKGPAASPAVGAPRQHWYGCPRAR